MLPAGSRTAKSSSFTRKRLDEESSDCICESRSAPATVSSVPATLSVSPTVAVPSCR